MTNLEQKHTRLREVLHTSGENVSTLKNVAEKKFDILC
jgi:hypothetical protein